MASPDDYYYFCAKCLTELKELSEETTCPKCGAKCWEEGGAINDVQYWMRVCDESDEYEQAKKDGLIK